MVSSDVPEQWSMPLCSMPGRGAATNPTGRFETIVHEAVLDAPDVAGPEVDGEEESSKRMATQFLADHSQSILTQNDSPDVGFSVSLNPYRGCEHGCVYCYARPTHEYLGMSCGLDFESKILVKYDAPKLLRKALSARSWVPQPIALSGVTDPYQPIERTLKLTRQCLEILAECRNPVGIVTKNHLVTRDVDLLGPLADQQAACVFVSVTTLDADLARTMEPRTSTPQKRLEAIRRLRETGIPVGVLMGPIIPGLTDHEIDGVLKAAADAGAQTASYTMLRLPHGVKSIFQEWLSLHQPLREARVLARIREMRDGKLNSSEFGSRMRGKGAYADYVARMFHLARKRHFLDRPLPPLSTHAFYPPGPVQLTLF